MSEFDRNIPIYLQIAEGITRKILSGIYAPGAKLPSVREIAAQEKINPNTAQRALSSLESEGLIVTERTSGRFVTENEALIAAKRRTAAAAQIAEFKKNMAEIGCSPAEWQELLKGELSKNE